jgi:hypothetical protein
MHVESVVSEHGERAIKTIIRFTYHELRELNDWFGPHLIRRSGRGSRNSLETVDQLYVLLLYLTSGMTFTRLARELEVPESRIFGTVNSALEKLQAPIQAAMPNTLADCPEATRSFAEFPETFGIVDPSPIFIEKPTKNQKKYYSGKFKNHCVKIQTFVNADGRCLHLSEASKGAAHDKSLFDASCPVQFWGITTVIESATSRTWRISGTAESNL